MPELHQMIPDDKEERELMPELTHGRRIELEDKAKIVASDWGTESLPR